MSEQKKKKCPTSQKRTHQDQKKRLLNRSFKSRVRTAINDFKEALSDGKKEEEITLAKSSVYRLVDKGVKKGIYKKNKAARVKSSLSPPKQPV